MNKRWSYIVLLALGLITIMLQVSGGLAQSMQLVKHVTPGELMIPGTRALIIDIMSFMAWIWGIFLTARRRQWRWMVLTILTSYIGGTIYALYSLFFNKATTHNVEMTHNGTEAVMPVE